MITYLDKVCILYPSIQNVMYWFTDKNGKPWNDPYDGLEWNNTEIEKPTKEQLDALTEEQIQEYKRRLENP